MHLEKYIKVCKVETLLVKTLGRSSILPVALDSLKKAADALTSVKAASGGDGGPAKKHFEKMLKLTTALSDGLDLLDALEEEVSKIEGIFKLAEAIRDRLLPQLLVIREAADSLELIIDDNRWSLPKYSELLWQ